MSDIEIHLKKLHQGQINVLNNSKRFNVLKIGRRFGKTTFAINYLIPRIAISGGFVAYFTPTYTDLADVWSEVKTRLSPIIAEKNEQTKQIKLITGGVIDAFGDRAGCRRAVSLQGGVLLHARVHTQKYIK